MRKSSSLLFLAQTLILWYAGILPSSITWARRRYHSNNIHEHPRGRQHNNNHDPHHDNNRQIQRELLQGNARGDYENRRGKGTGKYPTETPTSNLPITVITTNSPVVEVGVPDRSPTTTAQPTTTPPPTLVPGQPPTREETEPTPPPISPPPSTHTASSPSPSSSHPPQAADSTNDSSSSFVLATLEEVLQSFQYDTLVLQQEQSSYQSKAVQRTSEQEGVESFSAFKVVQYWVLYCIYYATNGSTSSSDQSAHQRDNVFSRNDDGEGDDALGWKNNRGWESSNQDPCSDNNSNGWYGITCDGSGQVTAIRLQRNGLSGIFPFREVVFLAGEGTFHLDGTGNLQVLDIYNNDHLSDDDNDDRGIHPWLESLVGLEILNYRNTRIKGPIPKLPYTLQEFDCSFTRHSGTIPDESFLGLNNLILANLDGNAYNSQVPTALATLPNLKFLYIREASITGNLAYMKGMRSIVEHAIDKNPGITGPVFSVIGNLYTLRSLSVSDCSLTGTLPVELATAGANLVQLWLHGNKLVGTIPLEYATISDLRILTLEDNMLSGTVPIEVCLDRFDGELRTLSVDCNDDVDCSAFFPQCCTCCGRAGCGS